MIKEYSSGKIDKDLNQTNYPLKSKSEVASDIINELINRIDA